MAAVVPESHSKVVEDTLEAMLPEPKIEEGEEFVDLGKVPVKTEEDPAPQKKAAAAPAKKEESAGDDDDIPEDLRGKSPKELARMYREAQQLIGRQGSELGEFRKKADMLIQANLAALAAKREAAPPTKTEEPAPAEIDDTEFFAKPKETIFKAIENHPLIKEIRETLGKSAAEQETARAAAATERFNSAHPDAAEIMQDPEFRQWIGASRVRQALLQRAHTRFDFDAGDEVFGTWKALKGVSKKADAPPTKPDTSEAARTLAAAAAEKKRAALQAAATPSGGSAGGSKEGGSKKIYRRADVLRLMEEDPERYEALAPEIEKAYRDGRVR